jgi:hypothetical protein
MIDLCQKLSIVKAMARTTRIFVCLLIARFAPVEEKLEISFRARPEDGTGRNLRHAVDTFRK